MSLAVAERTGRMSPAEFRRFQDDQPDHERWELFAGVPIMMAPALLTHQRIAGNLERLLNEALALQHLSLVALQRPGLELAGSEDYRPEPDVAVVDAEWLPDQRFATRAYLVAEIVSSTDRDLAPGRRRTKLDAKRRIYREHSACTAILSIEQDRVEVLIEVRAEGGWTAHAFSEADAEIVLPAFGLQCRVRDLYEHTPTGRAG